MEDVSKWLKLNSEVDDVIREVVQLFSRLWKRYVMEVVIKEVVNNGSCNKANS